MQISKVQKQHRQSRMRRKQNWKRSEERRSGKIGKIHYGDEEAVAGMMS